MPVTFVCPSCGVSLRASRRRVGRKAKCPSCHTGFVVASSGSLVPRLRATEIAPRPLAPIPRNRPRPPPQPPGEFEFVPSSRPRGANNYLGVIVVCSVALVLIVIGIAVLTRTIARPQISVNTGYPRPTATVAPQPTTTDTEYSQPTTVTPEAGVQSSGLKSTRQPGREVDVRSYTRRDGTPVRAHTRSAPSSRGGRR
jgi:hypothetical protein